MLQLERTPPKTLAGLLLLLLLLLAAPEIRGEEQDSLEVDLAACRRLVEREEWGAALEAYRELSEDHEGDPRLAGFAGGIEDDLKRAAFMARYEEPDATELFGSDVVSYRPGSRRITLEYAVPGYGGPWSAFEVGTTGPFGTKYGVDRGHVLRIRFEGKLTIEGEIESLGEFGVILCYEPQSESGYLVIPANPEFDSQYGQDRQIVRIDDGEITRLERTNTGWPPGDRFEISRSSSSIVLRIDGDKVLTARDREYRSGYVGFVWNVPKNVRIEGRVAEEDVHQRLGRHREAAFLDWLDSGWNPKRHLPAAIRAARGEPTASPALRLPGDPSPADARDLGRLAGLCIGGDRDASEELLSRANRHTGRDREYLRAIAGLPHGRLREAAAVFDAVLGADPDFAPARALRGMVRLFERRLDEARADLGRAREEDPSLEWAWAGLALVEFIEGRLEDAEQRLAEAAAAGLRTPVLEFLGSRVRDARRGPLWAVQRGVETTHFRIRSNHSKSLCREAANILESAVTSYSHSFPRVPLEGRRWRVHLFASRDGFLSYARSRSVDLENTAGFYTPRTRELVFFLGADPDLFVRTIRHEAFHAFLDQAIELAPPWFNEGCAEYFGAGRERFGGGYAPGGENPEAANVLRDSKERLVPLARLLRMSQEEFMGPDALLHYAQSWALVTFLMSTEDSALEVLLREYLAALRDGLTAEEAHERVFAPVEEELERAYREYVRDLG